MFLSATNLISRTITRLRMVAGASTQLYAEDAINNMLEEVYEMVRTQRWWDHMMQWHSSQLDGTTGTVVTVFTGARERFRDVQHVFYGNATQPIPLSSQFVNPHRLSGTTPRFIEPLSIADDADAEYLFRVWPLASVTDADHPLRTRYRADPDDLFTDPAVIVPFDATCLINGAAFRYAADDGSNPASVAVLQGAFEARLQQLQRQHDSATIELDTRFYTPGVLNEWTEGRW